MVLIFSFSVVVIVIDVNCKDQEKVKLTIFKEFQCSEIYISHAFA